MRQIRIILKIIWLYVRYWAIGLTDDYFYIKKANYFYELGHYETAVNNYKRALKDSNNLRLRIHDMIDYCYSLMGRGNDGLDYYRKAFEKTNDPLIGFGLARAEFNRGNLEKSQNLIRELRNTNRPPDLSKLDMLEAQIEIVKKEQERTKHIEQEFTRNKEYQADE